MLTHMPEVDCAGSLARPGVVNIASIRQNIDHISVQDGHGQIQQPHERHR